MVTLIPGKTFMDIINRDKQVGMIIKNELKINGRNIK